MNWNHLNAVEQIENLKDVSLSHPVLIFKHSTTCSISRTALDRLERNWKDEDIQSIKPFFLDLLSHRDVSTAIAAAFNVVHESPQILLVKNGKVIYHNSHFGIDYKSILKALKN